MKEFLSAVPGEVRGFGQSVREWAGLRVQLRDEGNPYGLLFSAGPILPTIHGILPATHGIEFASEFGPYLWRPLGCSGTVKIFGRIL